MKKKHVISLVTAVALMMCIAVTSLASDEIVILYTNDVHTYINNEEGLSYSMLAAYKNTFDNVILVDAGDHIQGTAYGGMDEGRTIIELMNATGYDLATLGNHEFDYGMERCLEVTEDADFPYVSCNFHSLETGENILDSYHMVEKAGKKIAFVGITTPETLTAVRPSCFQNESGEYIYDIRGGKDGSELYNSVQNAIDMAEEDGADHIIALAHLGTDESSQPYTSIDVIRNTTGLDAMIDGHSHSTVEGDIVKDKDGNDVVLTQTGSYLDAVGKMTIGDTITTELVTELDVEPDEKVKNIENEWIDEIEKTLGEVIAYSEVVLDNFDENGNRLVRKQSTNTGDLSADALYWFFENMDMDVDVAVMNGGGIRNGAISGEITYLDCKEIHTFANVACLQTVSGQQIKDALEWSVQGLDQSGETESGSFLHISGGRYSIDLSIPSTVQHEDGVWMGAPTGEYRVYDIEIFNKETGEYEPLDLDAKYNIAGSNYFLRDLGSGFNMFEDAVNVLDYAGEDYMVLAEYFKSFEKGENGLPTITAEDGYSDVRGSGRITFAEKPAVQPEEDKPEAVQPENNDVTYIVVRGDSLWKIAARHYGSGLEWKKIYEANRNIIKNPDLIYIGQSLVIPR